MQDTPNSTDGPPETPEAEQPRIPRAWPFKRIYYGWAILSASTFASFGMAPAFGPVLGVFFTSIEGELGWDRATMALAFTLGNSLSSVFQIFVGRLVDKYGARLITVAAGGLITLSMLGMWRMEEPWQFWLAFAIGRASAMSGIQMGGAVTLANWFIRKRARVIAIRGVGQRFGQFIMPLAIFGIMSIWGWREAFLVLAGVTAVTIILPAAIFIRRRPEDLGMTVENMSQEEMSELRASGRRGASSFARHIHDVSFTLAEARHTRAFWILLFFSIVDRLALGSINLHMVANFEDQGLPQGMAVLTLSIFALTSALTGLPWGFVFDRLHVRIGSMMVSTLFFLSVLLLIFADNIALAILFAVLYGAATGGTTIVGSMLWADYFGREHLGTIRSFGAPIRIFTPVGPFLTGVLYEVTGSYVVPFAIFAGIFALLVVLMYFATPPVKPAASVVEADEEPQAADA